MKIRKRTIKVALMTFLMIIATFGLGSVYATQEDAAFDQSKSAGDVTVTVTADPGVLPDGAQLKVKPLSAKQEAAANKAIDKIAGDAEVAAQYNLDIDIIDEEGNEIQPDTSKGKVNVYFESEEIADENLQTEIFHIDGKKAEELDVATKGDEAVVEADGFSPYVIRFTYGSGTSEKAFELLVGHSVSANAIAEAVGLTGHGNVTEAISNTNHVTVTHDLSGYYVKAENGWSGTSDFSLELRFSDGHQYNVRILSHAHNWDLQLNEAKDTATLKCVTGDNDSCYYKGEFTETIAASDARYDGQPHGASLSGNISGQQDMRVGDIYYASGHNTTTGGSTTAPTNAGEYTAYAKITADQTSGNKTAVIYKNYTIAKADINLTAATAKDLTYNGQDQELYNAASAKSAATDKTFTVNYRYSDSESWKTDILTGRNAGKYTITYKAFGDANHNDSEEKTLEVTIVQRAVIVKGVKANDKVYDGTKAATFDCSKATFEHEVPGADLTVTAEGEFQDKNAGPNKTVNITKYTLGGANASNYIVDNASPASVKATITPKTIKVHWEHPAELQYTGEQQAPEARFDFADQILPDDGKAFTGDKVAPVVSVDQGDGTNVGEHRAKVTGLTGESAENYELDHGIFAVDIEYKIIPKELTVDWNGMTKEYEAKPIAPDWELPGFVDDPAPTATLSLRDVNVGVTGETATDAGRYDARIELSGDNAGNYNISNPTNLFTITKAPLTVYAKGWIYYGEKVEKNGDIHNLQYDKDKITGFKGNDDTGVLEGDVIFNTNYNFLDDATGVNGAKYNLTPQFEKAKNYEVTNAESELTVYPKPVTLKWTHTHAGESEIVTGEQAFTYDGKLHTYKAEVTEDSYAKLSDGRPADLEITVTLSGDVQRDAHVKHNSERKNYTAYAESLSNPNYALEEVNTFSPEVVMADIETRAVDFTIAQHPVELSWEPERFTYNGDIQVPEVTIENLQFDDEGRQDEPFEVTVDFKQNSDPLEEARKDKSIEAGEYTVTATELADKNYTLFRESNEAESEPEPVDTIDFDYTIDPLAIRLKWDPNKTELTYNGKKQTQSVKVTNYAENIDADLNGADSDIVKIDSEGDWEGTDAGDYTATLKALEQTGRAGNYKFEGLDRKWKINKLPVKIKWNPTATQYTYDGKDHKYTAEITNVQSNEEGTKDDVSLKETGTWTAKMPGSFKATISGLDGEKASNYSLTGAKISHSWKINKLPVKIKWNSTVTQYTYNGKDHKYTAQITNVQSNKEGVRDDVSLKMTGTWTAKMPGSYKATISGLSGKNASCYVLTGAKTSHSWKINKRKATVGKPTLTNVIAKSADRANTGYWRTVSGATSYDFAWREKGGKWSVANAGKTYHKTVKNHKSKGLYEYKVRARKAATATDFEAVGNYSNVLYRYFFTLQHIQIRNEKGGFTVKWAKDSNATGYQVLYSTNKDGSNPKVITLGSNSITSRTVKGLKSGKVYYVQIRPIKKVGGTNYIGNISVIKPVKAF